MLIIVINIDKITIIFIYITKYYSINKLNNIIKFVNAII